MSLPATASSTSDKSRLSAADLADISQVDLKEEVLQAVAKRVIERCEKLATCSESKEHLARTFCSPAMKSAHAQLTTWMTKAGVEPRFDAAGNIIGRRQGVGDESTRRCVCIGSHLDTVVDAGRYDGPLGVMLGLAMIELLQQHQVGLPMDIDVLGFSEEEGVRFQSPYIGSKAIVGELLPNDPLLERLDAHGVSMGQALKHFGCDPQKLREAAYDPKRVAAFIEPHIEQGPVLEVEQLPVGVVSAIAGQTRARFRFKGVAGHAGTVPMKVRNDALVAASQFVVDVEKIAHRHPGMMATVGQILASPNVANVIPSEVAVRLDVRHATDSERELAFFEINQRAMAIAQRRRVACQLEWVEEQPAVECDHTLTDMLANSVQAAGLRVHRMPSGAGHDAVTMSHRFPTSLLFIRCGGGVSHHPDESVREDDLATSLRVLWHLIAKLAAAENARVQ